MFDTTYKTHNMSARVELFPQSLYTAYKSPIEVVEAHEHFYKVQDMKMPFLDLYNNVSHVGHSNPEVLLAVNDAYSTLNINTRYLQNSLTDYAMHLYKYVPQGSRYKLIFTNSGSESNDLALQIALNRFGGGVENLNRIGAFEGSYHGTTWLCSEVSHLTCTGEEKSTNTGVVKFISRQRTNNTNDTKCMIVECIQGVGGNFDIDIEYLKEIRAKTELLICDEVQTGFGRTGKTFWAFEKAEIIPDIITCGKPIANGYPMGACIIREELEKYLPSTYFNTFGGSTAACMVADAVLKIIEKRDLVKEVGVIGDWFRQEVDQLKTKGYIQQITGNGLFVGILLTESYDAKTVIERLKDEFQILVGIGWHNTIRIKPPTTVTCHDLGRFVYALDKICGE